MPRPPPPQDGVTADATGETHGFTLVCGFESLRSGPASSGDRDREVTARRAVTRLVATLLTCSGRLPAGADRVVVLRDRLRRHTHAEPDPPLLTDRGFGGSTNGTPAAAALVWTLKSVVRARRNFVGSRACRWSAPPRPVVGNRGVEPWQHLAWVSVAMLDTKAHMALYRHSSFTSASCSRRTASTSTRRRARRRAPGCVTAAARRASHTDGLPGTSDLVADCAAAARSKG